MTNETVVTGAWFRLGDGRLEFVPDAPKDPRNPNDTNWHTPHHKRLVRDEGATILPEMGNVWVDMRPKKEGADASTINDVGPDSASQKHDSRPATKQSTVSRPANTGQAGLKS